MCACKRAHILQLRADYNSRARCSLGAHFNQVCDCTLRAGKWCSAQCDNQCLFIHPLTHTLQDMVPKIVISMLVSRSKDDIHSELVRRLYSEISNVDVLLRGKCHGVDPNLFIAIMR